MKTSEKYKTSVVFQAILYPVSCLPSPASNILNPESCLLNPAL